MSKSDLPHEYKKQEQSRQHQTGRASLAAQTLRIHDQGGYWLNGECVVSEPMMRYSVDSTVLYPASAMRAESRADRLGRDPCKTIIEVTEETTIQAGSRLHAELGAKAGRALCLLNFASAKNPGGGFEGGSIAQEESLALSSGLYACLSTHMSDFYTSHRKNPDDGLYSHAMLYSPRVPFFRDDSGEFCAMWCAGVVTSPAPNAGVARKKRSDKDIVETLRERCGRVLAVAAEQGHTHLVLGAFGCGVFRNDASHVAAAFDYWLNGKYSNIFERVVFAIPFDQKNFPVFSVFFGDGSSSITAKKLERPQTVMEETKETKKGHASKKAKSRKDLHRRKHEPMSDD
jgi:uncharacterized protein (TIGR02452 family)